MGLFSSIGGLVNDLTGVSSSAKKGFGYSQALSNLNFEQQKYFAQNAHQLEMEDLKKAGLNPALTATGGSGASASGGGGIAGNGGSPAGTIFDLMNGIAGIYNSTRNTDAQTGLADAQTIKTLNESDAIPQRLKNETTNAIANKMTAEANRQNAKSNMISALANQKNAETNSARAEGGKLGNYIGASNAKNITKKGGEWTEKGINWIKSLFN